MSERQENNTVIEGELLPPESSIQVRREQFSGIQPMFDIEEAKRRLTEFQSFVKGYLIEGEDFGTIPGCPKPTLFKAGADKLCELYGFSDEYRLVSAVEEYDRSFPLFDYTVECTIRSIRHGKVISTGLGSCNSYEGKYRYRDSNRKCPSCGKESIIKGKEEYGGGWVCFKKKGGCGQKWADEAPEIAEQKVGKVENEDIATQKNTILKMAKKRAKVDATLAATRSSGIFTQDVEDLPGDKGDAGEEIVAAKKAAQEVARQKVEAYEKRKGGTHQRIVLIRKMLIDGNEMYVVSGYLVEIKEAMIERCFAYERPERKGEWVFAPEFLEEFTALCSEKDIHVSQGTDTLESKLKDSLEHPQIRNLKKWEKNLAFKWGDKDVSCWDKDLWPFLEKAGTKPVDLMIQDRAKDGKVYHNCVGIKKIGDRTFNMETKNFDRDMNTFGADS